jgi:hypothetical protein
MQSHLCWVELILHAIVGPGSILLRTSNVSREIGADDGCVCPHGSVQGTPCRAAKVVIESGIRDSGVCILNIHSASAGRSVACTQEGCILTKPPVMFSSLESKLPEVPHSPFKKTPTVNPSSRSHSRPSQRLVHVNRP